MSRWDLEVTASFEAAHHLLAWRGRPEPSHGHSWRVIARLSATRLDEEGMAFDFVSVRDALVGLVARFDHRDINSVAPFDRVSPTTERLAQWFFDELRAALPKAPLVGVSLYEGPQCCATYFEEEER